MQVNQFFINNGFDFIESSEYLNHLDKPHALKELDVLKTIYKHGQEKERAGNIIHLKLIWEVGYGQPKPIKNHYYRQWSDTHSNHHKILSEKILGSQLVHALINKNLNFARSHLSLKGKGKLYITLNFIRNKIGQNSISCSALAGLNYDKNQLVFVHLVDLPSHLKCFDNLIAAKKDRMVKQVIRLENAMDSYVINNDDFYLVNTAEATENGAFQNIIICTITSDSPHTHKGFLPNQFKAMNSCVGAD